MATARPHFARSMRQVGAGRFLSIHPRCPEAAVPQLQPAREQERATCAVAVPKVFSEAVARAREVVAGGYKYVASRVSLWCDSTGLVGAQGRCRAAYGLTPCSLAAKNPRHYFVHTLYIYRRLACLWRV